MSSAAYTSCSGYRSYPPYVNLSVRDGQLVISARGQEREGPDYPLTGHDISFPVPLEDAELLLETALLAVRAARG